MNAAELMEQRRELAHALRRLADQMSPGSARAALADRALLIELAESPRDLRELLTEVEAIGARLELGR